MNLLYLPQPHIGTEVELDWHAQELRSISGAVTQVRGTRPAPLRRVRFVWPYLDAVTARDLHKTLRSLQGPLTHTHWYSPVWDAEEVPVGTGDGVTTWWRVGITDVDSDVMVPSAEVGGAAIPVGDWGLGWENLLEASEDLSVTTEWTALGGATVTRTGGQADPDGGTRAWRIQTTGGTDVGKLDNIAYGGTSLPSSWRWYLGLWVRNLSATKTLYIFFRGFGILAAVPPSTPWTYYGGTVVPTVSFPAGIRFAAASAGDALDFCVYQPRIIAYQPDGTMVSASPPSWLTAYVPTPPTSYILGDTTLRRLALGFRTPPTSGASVVLRAWGRRLLWGRVLSELTVGAPAPGYVSMEATLEGEEATGEES